MDDFYHNKKDLLFENHICILCFCNKDDIQFFRFMQSFTK